MSSGPYRKVIDPRTRAEVAPEVVPFWHFKINTTGLEDGGNDVDEAATVLLPEANKPSNAKPKTWVQAIDLCSGLLSILALYLTIPHNGSLWKINNDLEWPMWHENILCYNTIDQVATETCINDASSFHAAFGNESRAGMQYAYNTTNAALQNYCKNNEAYMLPDNLGRYWNDTQYQCQIITQKHGAFRIWDALRVVFSISAIFQLTRFFLSRAEDNRYSPPRRKYYARKPDFWRWWEYALTSSIQIVIIGLSFFMGSQSELLALAGLQGALCFMGFSIEKRIDKLYKAKIKQSKLAASAPKCPPESTCLLKPKSKKLKYVKILVLLSAAWAFFIIIWGFILMPRFNRQADNPDNCYYGAEMPAEVRIIVYGELTLFAAFGVVQTIQVLLFIYKTYDRDQNQIYAEEFAQQSKSHQEWNDEREAQWETFAGIYSLLSITAKTILEFGLLELSRRFSDMI